MVQVRDHGNLAQGGAPGWKEVEKSGGGGPWEGDSVGQGFLEGGEGEGDVCQNELKPRSQDWESTVETGNGFWDNSSVVGMAPCSRHPSSLLSFKDRAPESVYRTHSHPRSC